jgi:hypothetical protein
MQNCLKKFKKTKHNILSKCFPFDFYTPQALVVIYYKHKSILTNVLIIQKNYADTHYTTY